MPPAEDNSQNNPQLREVADRLKDANNVLVTVSSNPSVDQLAACIGLTIALNKKDKHATAVFSGAVPSTIDFLEPEKTLEKNTDSLRDFIIALDKSKADKLRYKVEDEVVKIFITPYKTSISEADLEFSQGDFNVDAVVALGVHDRNELDAAIVAHGRILHDATIISVNISEGSELGSIHWQDGKASSLSEMACDLVQALDDKVLDSQIATAFLTGIVAQTDRFRNEKASPHTMTVSGVLMSAGASTQLVSSKLEQPELPKSEDNSDSSSENSGSDELPPVDQSAEDDGTIQIDHDDDIHIDDSGNLAKVSDILKDIDEQAQQERGENENSGENGTNLPPPESTIPPSGPSMVYEPPTFGGQLTANTEKVDQRYDHSPDPLTVPAAPQGPTLTHSQESASSTSPEDPESQTLSDLEKSLNSPHIAEYEETPVPPLPPSPPDVPPAEPDHARDAVERAVQASADYRPEPIQALGANQVGFDIDHDTQQNPPENSDARPGPPPPPVPPPLPPSS